MKELRKLTFTSPLKVRIAKTEKAKRQYFILNMNQYLNVHKQQVAIAKVNYGQLIKERPDFVPNYYPRNSGHIKSC